MSAAACQTAGDASMFPCAETPARSIVAAVGDARGAGVRGGAAVGGEERDLAEVALLVRRDQLGERVRGRRAGGEEVEPARAVAALGERLGRDGADPGRAHAHIPTPNARDCTATPSSPLASSRPTIE